MRNKLLYWSTTFSLVSSLVGGGQLARAGQESKLVNSESVSQSEGDSELLVDAGQVAKHYSDLWDRLVKGFHEYLYAPVEITDSRGNKSTVPRWQVEFNKAKIEIPIEVQVGSIKGLAGTARFVRKVVPSPDGRQLRLDTIEFEVANDSPLRVGARIRISSGKYFSLEDARNEKGEVENLKLHTLKSDLIRTIPVSGQQVVEVMKPDESLSLQIDGSVGLGKNSDKKIGHVKSTFGVGYSRGATAVMDINRTSNGTAKVLLIGIKNRGQFDINAKANWSLIPGIGGALGKALSLGVSGKFDIADRLLNRYPVDTMMVGYEFNLANREGVEALQDIFNGISKWGFIKLFDVSVKEEKLSQNLLAKIGKAEQYAIEDMNRSDFRVHHTVRAKALSQYFKTKVQGNAFSAASGEIDRGGSKTFIRFFDLEQNKIRPYIIWNEYFKTEGDVGLGNLVSVDSGRVFRSVDFLMTANNDNKTPAKTIALINKLEAHYGTMNKEAMVFLNKQVKNMVPPYLRNDSGLKAIIPQENQNSVDVTAETVIPVPGLNYIAELPYQNMNQKLMDFINTHPDNKEFNLSSSARIGEVSPPSLNDITEPMVVNLQRVLSASEPNATGTYFGYLMAEEAFTRWIAPEYIPQLIPNTSEAANMFGVKLKYSSSEVASRSVNVGNSGDIELYRSIDYLRHILSDRGFEDRLIEDVRNSQK